MQTVTDLVGSIGLRLFFKRFIMDKKYEKGQSKDSLKSFLNLFCQSNLPCMFIVNSCH